MPRQRRSRETVDRILAAARRSLVERGYTGTSTTDIAALAEVSPGSLYQYFADKDEIVAAVVAQFGESVTEQVAATVSGSFDQPPAEHLRTSLNALLDAIDVHPEFFRVVVEQSPRFGPDSQLAAFERRIEPLSLAYLTAHRGAVRPALDVPTAAWLMVRAVEHLTIGYVLDPPDISRERFVDEVGAMVSNYLVGA